MEEEIVVLDMGSGLAKAGFAGEPFPRVSIPSVVGKSKYPGVLFEVGRKDNYVGEEAEDKRGVLQLSYPIQDGVVTDWEDMESLLFEVFHNHLRISPNEPRGILIADTPLNPKTNRQKLAELLFETYNTSSLFFTMQGILSLYAAGYNTGMVLSVGEGVTYTTPVFEGSILPHAILRSNIAGKSVTNSLIKMMNARGTRMFTSSAEYEIARDIKEKLGYVALNYEEEVKKALTTKELEAEYKLPDERVLTLGRERFTCSEALFKPSFFLGTETGGIQDLVYDSINKCGLDLRKGFYNNIVVAGGTTLFNNFSERLQAEVTALSPPNSVVKVVTPKERKFSAWLGGSILGSTSLKKYHRMWIDREDWKEFGESVVFRKCY